MNYSRTLDFLYSQLPMFQRQGASAYKDNLDNTIALCEMLNNPQNSFPSIHIAGTNGKGSTANMLASVFQQAGYKTGLYTSPHLVDFRERIRINGVMIPENNVVNFVENYKTEFSAISPSFFELTFAMAIDYFRSQNVDIVIMETGMGGRLDSTNVVNSILSIITNIGLDHTQFLGNSLESIAKEKAGIIKKNISVVIGEYQKETIDIFKYKAQKLNSLLYLSKDIVEVKEDGEKQLVFSDGKLWGELNFPIKAKYQLKNLQTAIAGLFLLQKEWKLTKQCIIDGLENISQNTSFAGRWQQISDKPKIILDTGHNVDGLTYTMNQLRNISYNNLHFVFGMVSDKDIEKILELLPKDAQYYFCQANIPRAMDKKYLSQQALRFGLSGNIFPSVANAYNNAVNNCKSDDLLFVGGSTFIVAEVVALVQDK